MNKDTSSSPLRWRVTAFLAMAAALNYGDRAAMSAVFAPLRDDLGISDVSLGLLGSVFLWSYALCSPLAGMLADRWSRSLLIVVSLVLWSTVTALTGFANGLIALVVFRVLLGVTESLYLPAANALLGDHHGPSSRGLAMGLHSVGLNFGLVIGGTFAGYLADYFGWRAGFWVLGGMGVVLSIGSRFFLSDAPRPANAVVARSSFGDSLRFLLRVPSFHLLLAKAMLAGVGIWIFLNWLPLYFRESFGLSLGAAGFAGTFMLQISTVIGIAAGGWISDRIAARDGRRRMLFQALAYFACAPFLLLFLTHPGIALVTGTVTFFSLFRGLGQANENPTLCEIVPPQYRSTAFGIMNFFAAGAGGVGVLTAGLLKATFGLNAVFAGISGVFVLAGGALLLGYAVFMPRDMARARAFVSPELPKTS